MIAGADEFFIDPNQEIYKGQVVGENAKQDVLAVNLIKGKKLTNVRAAGSDEGLKIAPKIDFSLAMKKIHKKPTHGNQVEVCY